MGMHLMVSASALCNQLLLLAAHIASGITMEEDYRHPPSGIFTSTTGMDFTDSDGRMICRTSGSSVFLTRGTPAAYAPAAPGFGIR